MTKGFRHLGKVPVKGCGLTAAAGLYQRIELFDNAKALSVLRILVVPLIVKIFLNDFVDDLVDPVCEGIPILVPCVSGSTLKYRFGTITRLLSGLDSRYNLAILRAATITSPFPVSTIRKPSFVEETRLYFL